jgi:hypothetical protein
MSGNKNNTRTEKAKIIAISIILAIVAWVAIMWVDNPDITTTISDLGVRFVGEAELRDNGLVITGKKNIPEMSAVISGKRSDLMEFMDNICVEVDASQITETGEYDLVGWVSLPSSRLTVEKENQSDIPITVEKLETKEIEVRVKQTGTLKDKIVKSEIENPHVVISGAKSELDNVEYGLATVDISEVKDGLVSEVSYVLMDKNDNLIAKNETIETDHARAAVKNTIYNVKNLPITLELSDDMKEGYVLDKSKCTITPSRIDVGTLDYNTDSEVVITVKGIDNDGDLEYELAESDGMYVPGGTDAIKVKGELTKKVSKKLDLEVVAENAPNNSYAIERASIMVWGEESKLNSDNVKATVDLGGLDSGTYYLPVKITGDDISVNENYYVHVTIDD